MTRRSYLILALLGLGISLLVAAFQSTPGYMDAEYYFAGGLRLAQGHGFSEMLLWNYLDDPAGLPHPSHAYWMPLTSILAAAGMIVAGSNSFAAARLGFILAAMSIPPLTAFLAYLLTQRRSDAILAGVLALFSGFYVSFLSTTDAFGLYMLEGTLFLLLSQAQWRIARSADWGGLLVGFFMGAVCGLMHQTRADGLFWLFLALVLLGLRQTGASKLFGDRRWVVASMAVCIIGYLVLAGPWLWRNFQVFGSPLAPGGGHMLWLTNYNDLFIYPASVLSMDRWWQAGLLAALRARGGALAGNLQSLIGVQGVVLLTPLILLGGWRLRQVRIVQVGAWAYGLTFLVMTVLFPYAGARGGLFHSGAALQPLMWALAPEGLEACLELGSRLRGWNRVQARKVFRASLVVMVGLLTGLLGFQRVVGENPAQPTWSQGNERYVHLEKALVDLGAQIGDRVLVNNSPGYFVASGRPALSIPYGDVDMLRSVASRYQARYLLLEFNQLLGEDDLYEQPGDRPGLDYLGSVDDTRIYQLTWP
ncbi:MAG: hypothetical protein AB1894_09640 [Chloroflexota bacterium]